MREEIGQAVRDIFSCSSLAAAQEMKKKVAGKYSKSAPEFVSWLEDNIDEGLTVFQFPRAHWRRLRTTNLLERTNREIKRRTRVATLFPNTESCLRLATAVLLEIHDEWVTGKVYLDMTPLKKWQGIQYSDNYRKNVA
jgi:transposase-like protein